MIRDKLASGENREEITRLRIEENEWQLGERYVSQRVERE